MNRIRIAFVVGATSLLASCSDAGPTTTGSIDAASMAKSVSKAKPFGGRCDTSVSLADPQPGDLPNYLRLHITYVCQLQHLGRTTAVAEQLVIVTGPTTLDASSTATFTAANGDELYSTWSGTGVTSPDGGVVFSGPAIYAGGTGRFVNASGSTFISGSATLAGAPPFPGQFTLDGTLSY